MQGDWTPFIEMGDTIEEHLEACRGQLEDLTKELEEYEHLIKAAGRRSEDPVTSEADRSDLRQLINLFAEVSFVFYRLAMRYKR